MLHSKGFIDDGIDQSETRFPDSKPIGGQEGVNSLSKDSLLMRRGELSLCRYDYTLGSDRSVRIVMLVWELHLYNF